MTRPRGRPPQPRAMSSAKEPVGMTFTSGAGWSSPRRMIEPLPNCFSIVLTASSIAFSRLLLSAIGVLAVFVGFYLPGLTFRSGKSHPELGHVLGTRGLCETFVEDHLADPRASEVGLLPRREHLVGAPPLLHAPDRDVRLERSRLARVAELGHLAVDAVGERREDAGQIGEPDPQDARAPVAGKAARAARLE